MAKQVKEKIYIYIDANNLYQCIKSRLGWKIDMQKFYNFLQKKYDFQEVYVFIGERPEQKYQNLYQDLTRIGFKLVLKKIVITKQIVNTKEMKYNIHSNLQVQSNTEVRYSTAPHIKIGKQKLFQLIKQNIDSDVEIVDTIKGNCDGDMVFQMTSDFYTKETGYKAVVVTSDGDYSSVINFLKTNNALKLIISPSDEQYLSSLIKGLNVPIEYLSNHKDILQQ